MAVAANKIINRQAENTAFQNHYEKASNSNEYGKEYQGVMEARKKIGAILDDSSFQKLLSEKTLQDYKEYMAAQKGFVTKEEAAKLGNSPHADDLEGLLMMYEHMSKQWEAAKERLNRLNNLLGPLPKHYQKALIDKLILSGEYDLSEDNARKFEVAIRGKIKRFEENNKEFDGLAKHSMAKKLEVLKAQQKGSIKLDNRKSFIEATTLERREFLEKIKDAILHEEANEAYEAKEVDRMKTLYKLRLKAKYAKSFGKGCIGEKTYKVFIAELHHLDLEGVKAWHGGFEEQMAPREEFWKEARNTLREEGRNEMEACIHTMGMSQLRPKFEAVKKSEMARLQSKYASDLAKYQQQGLFGPHTFKELMVRLEPIGLPNRYNVVKQLDREMDPYRQIKKQIATLEPHQKAAMEKHRNGPGCGLTELEDKLKEFEKENGAGRMSEADIVLSNVQNVSKRQGIEGIVESLDGRNEDQFGKIIRLFDAKGRAKVDNEDQNAARKETAQPLENSKYNAATEELNEDHHEAADVIELEEFRTIKTDKGEEKHFVADEEKGMDNFLASYSGTEQEANLVRVSVLDESRQEVELNKQDAANVALYLKAIRKERQEQAAHEIKKT